MRAEARTAFWLALRHHPLCDRFDSDRFGPFCSGCALFWPAFLATTPLALGLALGDAWALLSASAVVGAPQLLTVRWRFGRLTRGAIKLLGGVAVSGALAAILLLPLPIIGRLGFLALMGASFLVLLGLRVRSILATCDACVWRRDWGHCPGFGAPEGPRPHAPGTSGSGAIAARPARPVAHTGTTFAWREVEG